MKLIIPHTPDFEVTGDGSDAAWQRAEWVPLQRVGRGKSVFPTRAKVLHSDTGLYFHTDAEDRRLNCTIREDNQNIYTEDVIEVFLWPDESRPLYFEYEISPLGVELPILVPNNDGRFHGWLPWHYEKDRRTRRATAVRGGPKEPMATVSGWTTEFFIPYRLLVPLGNVPPAPGSSWRANIYRIDYDTGALTQWAWHPATGDNFHDYRNFGTFEFAR